jgi:hypothetical protein
MFGVNYIKFDSMTYAIHYANGHVKREGRGLSFFYYSPTSSITAIPMGSKDIQFIFNESTKDFQTITIQGQVTYAIHDPKQLSEMLDFTLDHREKVNENNFEKLNQRLNNEAQTAAAVLGHNYPSSTWYQEAYQLLQKQGLAPQVNEGSPLAGLFRRR